MKTNIFLLVIFCLFGKIVAAQNVVTFEAAVKLAIENNITIKQQENQLKVTQAEKDQTIASLFPNVGISGSAYTTDGRQWSNEEKSMINTSVDRANYSIGAQMTIFDGFRKIHQVKQSRQQHIAQKKKLEQSQNDLILLVMEKYLQILLDKELLFIGENNLYVQKQLYERIKAHVDLGIGTLTDLLIQTAQLSKNEANVITLNNRVKLDKISFAKILLLDPTYEFDVTLPNGSIYDILMKTYSVDSLYNVALKSRSDFLQLQAEKQATFYQIKIAKSAYSPKLNLFYNYGSFYASNSQRLNSQDNLYYDVGFGNQFWKENSSHQYGINLSIPIFSQLQNRTNNIRSRMAYYNTKLIINDYEAQIYSDIKGACQDFVALKESYQAKTISANAAKLVYEKQYELYKMGEGDLITLNLVNQSMIQAQSEKIQIEYTLLFYSIVIDYYSGQLLNSFF